MSNTPPPDGNEPPWYGSYELMFILTIVSLILAVFALYPIIQSIRTGVEPSPSMKYFMALASVFVVFFLAWCGYQFTRNRHLANSISLHRRDAQASATRAKKLETDLEQERELRKIILLDRDRHYRTSVELFRNFARRRAAHSVGLYGLSRSILSSAEPVPEPEVVSSARALEKTALQDFCTYVSQIFSHLKGRQCCANIKVIFDTQDAAPMTLAFTEFGLKRGSIPESRIGYFTVARCYTSAHDGRTMGTAIPRRMVMENIILRELLDGTKDHFKENDMANRIKQWREKVVSGETRDFKFPDEEATKYYNALIIQPLVVSQKVERTAGEKLHVEHVEQFIGFLLIDSKGEGVEFDDVDLTVAEEFAQGVISMAYEYFSYVRQLKSTRRQ